MLGTIRNTANKLRDILRKFWKKAMMIFKKPNIYGYLSGFLPFEPLFRGFWFDFTT
jgi:hypothetical protein